MPTIDQLDISVYNMYAIRTRMFEQFNREIHLEEAVSIPPQIKMVDIYPKLTEMDLLLGVVPVVTPWAYFYPPRRFRRQRRSSFSFFRIAPSLGSFEEQEAEEAKLAGVRCKTVEEKEEKEILERCLAQVAKVNEWLSFIIGRVGQFLQG